MVTFSSLLEAWWDFFLPHLLWEPGQTLGGKYPHTVGAPFMTGSSWSFNWQSLQQFVDYSSGFSPPAVIYLCFHSSKWWLPVFAWLSLTLGVGVCPVSSPSYSSQKSCWFFNLFSFFTSGLCQFSSGLLKLIPLSHFVFFLSIFHILQFSSLFCSSMPLCMLLLFSITSIFPPDKILLYELRF